VLQLEASAIVAYPIVMLLACSVVVRCIQLGFPAMASLPTAQVGAGESPLSLACCSAAAAAGAAHACATVHAGDVLQTPVPSTSCCTARLKPLPAVLARPRPLASLLAGCLRRRSSGKISQHPGFCILLPAPGHERTP